MYICFHIVTIKGTTLREANSLKPISTESILSIFPSPVRSFKSRTFLLRSGLTGPAPCQQKDNKTMSVQKKKWINEGENDTIKMRGITHHYSEIRP